MSRQIRFKNNPLTLLGRPVKKGDPAPLFKVTNQDLKEVGLVDFGAKIKIINTFPSLDTPVCDLQVKEFNRRAADLSAEIAIIGISKDLPFAQKRFCQAFEIKNLTLLSDYKTSSFGINYGLLIKELNLLCRSVLIIDKNEVVRYFQLVPELTLAPDYADAIKNLQDILKSPASQAPQEPPAHCRPCEIGSPALPEEKIRNLLVGLSGWELIEAKKLVKEFKFKDFLEAKYFLDLVSLIAEEQGHHPTLTLIYNKLKVTLTTHASGGLTDNDFIMAKIIDQLNS